jgi:putative peptidoglycan lipid II flippase
MLPGMQHDSNRSILKSAGSFLTGTLISRLTGLLRDVVMAFVFGTSAAVAAFMVAFRFSHLLRRLLGEGCMQTAFIPHFEEVRKRNPEDAFRLFLNLNGAVTLFLLVLIPLSMFSLWGLTHAFTLSAGNLEIINLTILMLPGLLFICLYGLNAALLQCEQKFFLAGVAPVAFNLIWTVAAWSLRGHTAEEAMPWLTGGIVAACLAQWAITLPATWPILKKGIGRFHWKELNLISPDLRQLGVPLFLGIIGVGASQINSAVDAVFARWADSEGPAYLWYSIRIQQLPLALFGIALAGALLPPLSRAAKQHDWKSFHYFLDESLIRSYALMAPLTIALLILGPGCVNGLYGRGDFDDAAIAGTTLCLWGYAIGLIPMTQVLLVAPAFYAQGNYRFTTIASVIAVAVNIVLNTVMIAFLGLGAASVAAATSLSSFVNYFLLSRWLAKQTHATQPSLFWPEALKVTAAALLAAGVTVAVEYAWRGDIYCWQIWRGVAESRPHTLVDQFLYLTVLGGVFVGVTITLAFLLRVRVLKQEEAVEA